DSASTTPQGMAIFGYRPDDILVSEAAVPASAAIVSGRIYAEVGGSVDTGLAIANPNSQAVTLTFYVTDAGGNNVQGSTTIAATSQIAAFLDQAPSNAKGTVNGTFTFTASAPAAVAALRGRTHDPHEHAMTTVPAV